MSSRRIHNVSETYCKDDFLQKDLPGSHLLDKFMVNALNLQE